MGKEMNGVTRFAVPLSLCEVQKSAGGERLLVVHMGIIPFCGPSSPYLAAFHPGPFAPPSLHPLLCAQGTRTALHIDLS